MTTLNGIDVSGIGQGAGFDWVPWRGKISFAFIKASEGLTFKDPDFARNWQQAKAEGITRGAYHFLHPDESGTAQAHYFLSVADPQPGDLVMTDYEVVVKGQSPAAAAACAVQFADTVRSASGAWPVTYTTQWMAEEGYCAGLGGTPAFIANPSHVTLPDPAGPWKLVSFEQTGQRGVDTDVFYGGAAQLAKLSVPHPAAKLVTKQQATAALASLTAYVAQS